MAKRNVTLHDKYKSTTALYPKIDAKSLTQEAITEITKITEVVVEEQVVPNPIPTGEEPNLEYITINNVTYKVPTSEPTPQVQSNWNETDTDSPAYIQNKPTIPSAQVQSNWNENDNTSPAYIQNKPTLFSYRELMTSSSPVSSNGSSSVNVPVNTMNNINNYVEATGYIYKTSGAIEDRRYFTARIKAIPYDSSNRYFTRVFIEYDDTADKMIYLNAKFLYNTSDLKVEFSLFLAGTSSTVSDKTIVIEHIKELINY